MERVKVLSRRATPQTKPPVGPQSFPECKSLAEARTKWKAWVQSQESKQVNTASVRSRESVYRTASAAKSQTSILSSTRAIPNFKEDTVDVIHMIDNQEYDSVLPEFGLTAQDLLVFNICGLDSHSVSSLRSLFISLDKDGGGELGPDEVFEALRASGQKVWLKLLYYLIFLDPIKM